MRLLLIGVVFLGACGPAYSTVCEPWDPPEAVAGRVSPYASHSFRVGGTDAVICYSRPYVRGREVFGGLVPYDTLWRTGANEPTILHLSDSAEVAGIRVRAGSYSLYTVPSASEAWTLVINSSTSQWGLTRDEYGRRGNLQPNAYTEEVRRSEVGRAAVETSSIPFVEQLTIRSVPAGAFAAEVLVEWERTQIAIPVRAFSAGEG